MPSKYAISLLRPSCSVYPFPGCLARYRGLFKATLVESQQAGAPRYVSFPVPLWCSCREIATANLLEVRAYLSKLESDKLFNKLHCTTSVVNVHIDVHHDPKGTI